VERAESGWVFFTIVAALLGAASGEAFAFGWARFRDLAGDHGVRLRHSAPLVIAAVAVAVGLVYATPYVLGDKAMTGRGIALSALAIVGALPAATALAAVQRIARRSLPGGAGDQLCALLGLRRLTARLLNQLGLLVLLVTMVNGAATGWGAELPKTVVIFSGAVASFVVGVMYIPAATTLRRRGSLYVDRYFPLNDVPITGLVAAAESRSKLEHLLGTDRTTFDELKAGLVILTPFVVSALAALVPRL
jgi:hypothetical protein